MFGIAAMVVLAGISFKHIAAAKTNTQRALVAALVAWAIFTTFHAATRLAAIGFIFGMSAATFVLDDEPEDEISPVGEFHR